MSGTLRQALDAIQAQCDALRSLKGWRLNLIRENLAKAYAAAPREWQPIETLPRDGRYVLVYRPLAMETGDETLAIVRTTEYPTTSPQGVKHWTSRWCHPTHWVDLPELPAPPSPIGGEQP